MTTHKKKIVKKMPPKLHCHEEGQHPDHKKEKIKLNKAKGQIGAIIGMIDQRLYCPDILIQVRAAKSALYSVEQSILKRHIDSCVSEAVKHKDEKLASEKVEELIKLISRHQ
ncbi:MAG: metal-sensitive transcriptional regulator [Rhizobacter sp.]|nr:metal-sensitive transcriptional regulator [Bacteriovorax sp.]